MLPHHLINFESEPQNAPKFNDAYSRNNLTKIKNGNNATYFVSFGFEHIPKEIEKLISNKKKLK